MDPYRKAHLSPINNNVPKDFGTRLHKIAKDNLQNEDRLPQEVKDWLYTSVYNDVVRAAHNGDYSVVVAYPFFNGPPYMKKVMAWCASRKLKCEPCGETLLLSWQPREWKLNLSSTAKLAFYILFFLGMCWIISATRNETFSYAFLGCMFSLVYCLFRIGTCAKDEVIRSAVNMDRHE